MDQRQHDQRLVPLPRAAISPFAITTYNAAPGSNTTGSFYSFGAASSNERAFGAIGSGGTYYGSQANGAVCGWIAVSLTNGTADTLTDVTIGFDGEQWRDGGSSGVTPAAQTMVLEYGFGATFGAVTAWTAPGGAFNWSSPVITNTGGGAMVDGNDAGRVAGRGGTISNLAWEPGQTMWVRWVEVNDAGNDHGLAIDNFSFSATPTPGAAAVLSFGMLAATRRRRA
ncbi:MAG: hypothetical protein QM783_13170 [Phycisphaerales bacterium]